MKKAIAWAVVMVAMASAPLSQAAQTTVNFAAVVTSADTGLPAVGSTIRGAVTFGDLPSTTTYWPSPAACVPDSVCPAPTGANHVFDAAPSQFWLDFGGTVITSNNIKLNVSLDLTLYESVIDEFFGVGIPVDWLSVGTTVNGLTYNLSWLDRSNSISGVAVSDAIAFLERAPQEVFFGAFGTRSSSNVGLSAQLTSLSVTTVPEPSTAILLALGLGGVMTVATRRRQASLAHQAVNEA